jgi:hypothetical protein
MRRHHSGCSRVEIDMDRMLAGNKALVTGGSHGLENAVRLPNSTGEIMPGLA